MKYFIDTEFKEYFKQHKILNVPVGYPTPTIDLISIGIVCEDGRHFYALNKECDLKEIWKDEWLQENVLLPFYKDYVHGDMRNHFPFSYSVIKGIFKRFGKTKIELTNEISQFVNNYNCSTKNIEFYGYYSDYDWVVFCQLFGRMLDLPKGFPMYCKDLKQTYDEINDKMFPIGKLEFSEGKMSIKQLSNYPKQDNEHNALDDAKWNYELYKFLKSLE